MCVLVLAQYQSLYSTSKVRTFGLVRSTSKVCLRVRPHFKFKVSIEFRFRLGGVSRVGLGRGRRLGNT